MSTNATEAMTTTRTRRRSLSGKDLINVGVFTTIYFVLMFAFGMLGILGPWVSLLGYALGMLANGIVIALYLARVPRFGALTLMMVIVSALMTLTGHPAYGLIVSPLIGLAADLVAASGRYRNKVVNATAYGVMTLWYLVPMLPLVWDTVGYKAYVAASMGEEYATAYLAIFTPLNLLFFGIGAFCIAFVSGLFGQRLVTKHFRKAGVA